VSHLSVSPRPARKSELPPSLIIPLECSSGDRLYDLGRLADPNIRSICWGMSTPDQLLYSALHGTAMRYAAERRNLDESIEELCQIAVR
jgi:hypothetical protein